MKRLAVTVLILSGLASACTVREERTVVEKPTPAPATVVAASPPPPAIVVVPSD